MPQDSPATNKFDAFLKDVVAPVLKSLRLHGSEMELRSACQLLMGTAIHESGGLVHRVQLGGGPARSFFQIEPATLDDLFENYLDFRPEHRYRVLRLVGVNQSDIVDRLATNDQLATAVARYIYYRRPEPMPRVDDIQGHAQFWKDHYNTALGKGTTEKWIADVHTHAPWLYDGAAWEEIGL